MKQLSYKSSLTIFSVSTILLCAQTSLGATPVMVCNGGQGISSYTKGNSVFWKMIRGAYWNPASSQPAVDFDNASTAEKLAIFSAGNCGSVQTIDPQGACKAVWPGSRGISIIGAGTSGVGNYESKDLSGGDLSALGLLECSKPATVDVTITCPKTGSSKLYMPTASNFKAPLPATPLVETWNLDAKSVQIVKQSDGSGEISCGYTLSDNSGGAFAKSRMAYKTNIGNLGKLAGYRLSDCTADLATNSVTCKKP